MNFYGTFPSHVYDLTQTGVPTSPSSCPVLGKMEVNGQNAAWCTGPNTFALLVDTDAPPPDGPRNAVLPPFWGPYMLQGAPASVPVVPIPAPTPVS